MSEAGNAHPNPPKAKPIQARRRAIWRWPMVWLGLLSLVVLVLALTGMWALARTEAGTGWLLARVPGLTFEGQQGALLGERLHIKALRWQGDATQPSLRIEEFEWTQPRLRWLPHAGAWAGLSLNSLRANRLILASPKQASSARVTLTQLRMPFQLQVAEFAVDTLQIDELAPLLALRGALQLGADDGRQHRVDGLQLRTDRATVSGALRIDADGPLALHAQMQADSTSGPPWRATLQAQGPLADFEAKARLRSEDRRIGATALDAVARIQPFAPWPLAALELSAKGLDLASLFAGAPRTRLDAQAQIHSAGLDQPARASVRIDNHLAGRWDAQALPVKQLQIELGGTPSQLDRLTISRFDAVLADAQGPAGRLQGRGEWLGPRLQMQMQLSDIQPARLDARAGVLSVSGPLTLDITGLPAANGPARNAKAPAWRAQIDAALAGTFGATGASVNTELVASLGADQLEVTRLVARSGQSSANASLKAERDAQRGSWRLNGQGEIVRFDPLPWWPGVPGSAWARGPHRFDGSWRVNASGPDSIAQTLGRDPWAALLAVQGEARIELGNSLLVGVPLAGRVQLNADTRTVQVDAQLTAAGNELAAKGQVAVEAAKDAWHVNAKAPALAALQPLWRLLPALSTLPPLAGEVQIESQVTGRWPSIEVSGQLSARQLRSGDAMLASAAAQWRVGEGEDAALELKLTASDLRIHAQRVDAIDARIEGSRREHRLSLRIDSPLRPPAWAESLLGSTVGGLRASFEGLGRWQRQPAGGSQWRGSDATLRVGARQGDGPAWLDVRALQGSVTLDPRGVPQLAQLAPGRALLPGGAALRWSEASWQGSTQGRARIDLRSELEPLAVAPMLARFQPEIGWGGDLTLAGRIEVHAADRFDADIVLERTAGDLRIADEIGTPQALGLSELRLAFSAHDGVWQFAQGAAGRQLGEMAGAQVARTTAQARWPGPDTPLDGVVEMRVANLGAWGVWVPPGWRLGGNLRVSGALGGRVGAPELRGDMRGADLSVRNALQGVGLSDGELVATLEGDVARVQSFSFKGGDGRLMLTGVATLGDAPSARLHLTAERFRVLGRIDRRLLASGNADLHLRRDSLQLNGKLTIDEGLIDFSRGDAPSLDSDVSVIRAAPAKAVGTSAGAADGERKVAPLAAPLRNAQIALSIDLGERLQLRGRGLDTFLQGDLRITSPGGKVALNGTVRTASGSYVAYGQKMSIERGELVFTGSADNPRLDIIAVRPGLDVRVGVSAVGPLANPRIRLFSEPEMSEINKLSWLVLGRATEGLGRTDTALLQRAAFALLAGEREAPTDQLLGQLGLTEFSLRQSEGEVRETIVALGKQLSNRWYVGYERSVNATTGTWQLIYRIAQRFTLRAQSGAENSMDVIWSWRW